MNVLGLDLGDTVGAALQCDGRVTVQTFDMHGQLGANEWQLFRDWLLHVIGSFAVKEVRFETPAVMRGDLRRVSTLLGQLAILQLVCADEHLSIMGVYPGTLRKFLWGTGRMRSAEAKRRAQAKAEEVLGRRVTDHEADACCMLLYMKEGEK